MWPMRIYNRIIKNLFFFSIKDRCTCFYYDIQDDFFKNDTFTKFCNHLICYDSIENHLRKDLRSYKAVTDSKDA